MAKNIVPKPTATRARAYFVILNAMIWAVIVVPTFAPMITPTDCWSDSRPAEMNPTTSTVVTDEDWITAVTKAPVVAAMNRFFVSLARTLLMPEPATDFNASVICSMPNKKTASPPRSPMSSGARCSSCIS